MQQKIKETAAPSTSLTKSHAHRVIYIFLLHGVSSPWNASRHLDNYHLPSLITLPPVHLMKATFGGLQHRQYTHPTFSSAEPPFSHRLPTLTKTSRTLRLAYYPHKSTYLHRHTTHTDTHYPHTKASALPAQPTHTDTHYPYTTTCAPPTQPTYTDTLPTLTHTLPVH